MQGAFTHTSVYEAYAQKTFCAYFSPLAFQALLQTSVLLSKRVTGAAMSLIKNSEIDIHSSPRSRITVDLPSASRADGTGFPYEEAAPTELRQDNSTENPLNIVLPLDTTAITHVDQGRVDE
jgi:hypothetical protein